MREKKGITILALVVTICVMLILASIGIYTGVNSVNSSKDSIARAELDIVQHAVLETYTKYRVIGNEETLIGNKQTYEQVNNSILEIKEDVELKIENYDSKGENIKKEEYYYELTPEDAKKIGIEKAKDIYIVNYKTGEVINKTKLKTSTNEPLYVYSVEKGN